MFWFTWRQFRTPAVVTAAALAVFGVLLLVTVPTITDLYAEVAACSGDCATVTRDFLTRLNDSAAGTLYFSALAVMYLTPALVGIFWGAPLVARELETGTHRLIWNQAVSRTRWLASKLVFLGATTVAVTGLLSVAVTGWADRIDGAAGDRITPLVYGARGVVPVGYAVFAFTLGVACGMLIRRTMPAMAATLAGYTAAAVAMPLWLRTRLVVPHHETPPLDLDNLEMVGIHQDGSMEILGAGVPNAWTVSNQTIAPGGEVFHGPANLDVCGRNGSIDKCEAWIGSLGLRQDVVYHPDSQFWALQWTETGILLALAALLVVCCFWRIRRLS